MDGQSSSTGMKGPFRFLPAEVKEMEERLFPVTNRRLDHILMDELAVKFSYFRGLAGMTPVKPKQVLNWFHNNRNKHCPKVARKAHPPVVSTREFWANHQQARGCSLSKLKPMVTTHAGSSSSSGNNYIIDGHIKYEAKLARDDSWFDVQDFVAQRFCESGDLKLLVHFSGFGVEEAEWSNARTCLRQRSVPYKATECANVHCWDPVLCYKRESGWQVVDEGDLGDDSKIGSTVMGADVASDESSSWTGMDLHEIDDENMLLI
ncbi:protein SAWADEE HOMEODOMAIN HOMOLOG 2-like [Miscanthus floridulus]|uniref:protein SAWADEE HOMEODOMAIN HOMOLOG 2-like n=1 Tax=Miscanthus floridulus TaxID=154761 RepID=UPI003457E337